MALNRVRLTTPDTPLFFNLLASVAKPFKPTVMKRGKLDLVAGRLDDPKGSMDCPPASLPFWNYQALLGKVGVTGVPFTWILLNRRGTS